MAGADDYLHAAVRPAQKEALAERRRRLRSPADGVPGFNHRVFVARQTKVMFMAVNKNACTSLKWMMAEVCNEDLSGFRPLLQPCVSMDDAIHVRRLWKVSPRILRLDDDERAAMSPGEGWFVFAVVRDPRARLFSAWQNKLLLDHPDYQQFRAESWYPRHPVHRETIVEDFGRFVRMLGANPDHPFLQMDGHFRNQSEMLMLDTFEYTQIYDVSELGRLRSDLAKHLEHQGWSGELHLSRLNETPLRPTAEVFANGVQQRVEDLYRRDIDVFGDIWRPEDSYGADWSQAALDEIDMRAAFGRRLTDLLNRANRVHGLLQVEREENAKLQRRLAELEPTATS